MTLRLPLYALVAIMLVAAGGCSDDTGADDDCPPGQSHHPIEETCVVDRDDEPPPDASAGDPDTGGDPDTETNDDADAGCQSLDCAEDVSCQAPDPPTTLTGTVTIPSGEVPLPDVHVYVPEDDSVDPMPQGASCRRCDDPLSGDPALEATTDIAGDFELTDVPVADELPLVVEVGKWRRQIAVSDVQPCAENPVDTELTRLPANRDEGHLPRVAMTTGGCDAMECLMRKIGVDDSEFTTPDGDGSIHLLAGDGGTDRLADGDDLPDATDGWWDAVSNLMAYDIVVHSCECSPNTDDKPDQARQALEQFTDAGGRAFLSHWHNEWLRDGPFETVADWDPLPPQQLLGTATGHIDTSFPKGEDFRDWMGDTGTDPADEFTIHEPRGTIDGLDEAISQRWIYLDETEAESDTDDRPQYFSFNTPIAADEDSQCGRVVFSDIHVAADHESGPDYPFPSGCNDEGLTDQEKALVFMLFDLSRCIVDDGKKPSR